MLSVVLSLRNNGYIADVAAYLQTSKKKTKIAEMYSFMPAYGVGFD